MSVELIQARIKTVMRNLPPLPAVTRQLLVVIGDENSSANDVSKVLSSDQALAGKVLKLVNSSFYGVQQEVTTISRAVVLLGFTGVRNLALGFGSISALQKLGGKLDMQEFWAHALANGAASQSLALHFNRRTDPEEAFLAGLMHDIGAYVLAAAIPEIYGGILAKPAAQRMQAEQEACGLTHAQVGQGLLKFWELPDAFCDAARHHHDAARAADGSRPLTNLVALADVLACVHGGAFEAPASEADIGKLMAGGGFSVDHVVQALGGMDRKIADMTSFLHIAGAQAGAAGSGPAAEATTCVVVSTDRSRQEWLQALLQFMGQSLFPMEAFFNHAPGSQEVGLVMVDPQCLTAQKLEQLMVFLGSQPAKVCMVTDPGVHLTGAARACPVLPFVFSREDLGGVLCPQPA